MLPKSACNVNKCEIAVILKLTPRGDVEPLPFIVIAFCPSHPAAAQIRGIPARRLPSHFRGSSRALQRGVALRRE